jgi:SAM-dependent methyltransferase
MPDEEHRVRRERESYERGRVFQNSAAIHLRFRHVLYSPNSVRGQLYYAQKIASISPGSQVLEFGCGAGTELLGCNRGYSLIGIDLSFPSLQTARKRYGRDAGLCLMDAHRTAFRNESFDVIVGGAILHHLNFERAVHEIRRLLKPGGWALFSEPLFDNPAAKLWRYLTPQARTSDERPLSRLQIRWADGLFSFRQHCFVNLVSTPVAMLTSLVARKPDNLLLRVADKLDSFVEKTPAKYWMRMVYLFWQK